MGLLRSLRRCYMWSRFLKCSLKCVASSVSAFQSAGIAFQSAQNATGSYAGSGELQIKNTSARETEITSTYVTHFLSSRRKHLPSPVYDHIGKSFVTSNSRTFSTLFLYTIDPLLDKLSCTSPNSLFNNDFCNKSNYRRIFLLFFSTARQTTTFLALVVKKRL